MKRVAEINGINVFSDMKVMDIDNTRITFENGSWCDVATGKVVIRGTGSIKINKKEQNPSGEKVSFFRRLSRGLVLKFGPFKLTLISGD